MKTSNQVLGTTLATIALMLAGATAHAKKQKGDQPVSTEYNQIASEDDKCWPEVDGLFDDNGYSVNAESTKDLSNIVLLFADGSRERFEDLSDREGVFAGTGENAGKVLTGVWIKSGCNHSYDGPGYGQFVENSVNVTYIPVVSISDAPGVLEPFLTEMVEVLFEVSLSEMVPLNSDPVIVTYATRDGTTTAGMDYFSTSGELSFAPGEMTKTISVMVLDDYDSEDEVELFYVDLSNPVNALPGTMTGTGTIIDDDQG